MITKSNNLFSALCLIYLLFWTEQVSAGISPDKSEIKKSYDVVHRFYDCVKAETRSSDCNTIFVRYEYQQPNYIDNVWKFIDNNKNLFYWGDWRSSNNQNKDIFMWATKIVSFYNPPDAAHFDDGQIYLTLSHIIPEYESSGMYKEISFPLVVEKNSGKIQIQFLNIKINGLLLGVNEEFSRNFNVIEKIGFKHSTR